MSGLRSLGGALREWGNKANVGTLQEVTDEGNVTTHALAAGGAAIADGGAAINDFVGGAAGTDEHGLTLLTSRYAEIGATNSAGNRDACWRFDCTGNIANLYLNGSAHINFRTTDIYPQTSGVKDLGTTGKMWKDGYFSGTVYADDLDLTGDANIDGALNHDGTNVGFYGTAPIAQQAGVGVNAAEIHAALVNLGLITA